MREIFKDFPVPHRVLLAATRLVKETDSGRYITERSQDAQDLLAPYGVKVTCLIDAWSSIWVFQHNELEERLDLNAVRNVIVSTLKTCESCMVAESCTLSVIRCRS